MSLQGVLTAPYPKENDYFNTNHRTIRARFKLHILMARLRCGLRRIKSMGPSDGASLVSAHWCLQKELEYTMIHVGFIFIHGLNCRVPYLLRELSELYDPMNDRAPDFYLRIEIPPSINMEFCQSQDEAILQPHNNIPTFGHWWKDNNYELKWESFLNRQFELLWDLALEDKSLKEFSKKDKQFDKPGAGALTLILKAAANVDDVPGLAERPVRPYSLPSKFGARKFEKPVDRAPCEDCIELKEVLRVTRDNLIDAKRVVSAKLEETREAVAMSSHAVAIYDRVGQCYTEHGAVVKEDGTLPEDVTFQGSDRDGRVNFEKPDEKVFGPSDLGPKSTSMDPAHQRPKPGAAPQSMKPPTSSAPPKKSPTPGAPPPKKPHTSGAPPPKQPPTSGAPPQQKTSGPSAHPGHSNNIPSSAHPGHSNNAPRNECFRHPAKVGMRFKQTSCARQRPPPSIPVVNSPDPEDTRSSPSMDWNAHYPQSDPDYHPSSDDSDDMYA